MKKLFFALLFVFGLAVPTWAQPSILAQGALTSLNDTVCASNMVNVVSFNIQISNTLAGTVTFQGTATAGPLVSLEGANVATGAVAATTTAAGLFAFTNTGYQTVCATMTSYTSGGVNVTIARGYGAGGAGGGSAGGGLTDAELRASAVVITGAVVGGYGNDANAATTDRLPTLPGITETSAPSRTNGRNAALSMTAGGATRVMITDAAGAATTIATDATLGTTTFTEATSTAPGLVFRNDTPDSLVNTTNEATPLGTSASGALWVAHIDPCSYKAKSVYVVNLAATGTVEVANAVAGEFWYICSVNLVAQGANAFLIAHDDTDGCGSITAGMNGGTTAATGWGFAANGGISLGNGQGTILKSATANHYLCIAPSTTAQISGTILYVSAP